MFRSQDLLWKHKFPIGIPRSTLEPQNPHWRSKMHTVVLGWQWISTNHILILVSTLQSQEQHRKSRIHTRVQRSTLESQDPHNNPTIYATTFKSTVVHQNLYLNIRIHTETPESSLESRIRNASPESTLAFSDPYKNSRINTGIPEY